MFLKDEDAVLDYVIDWSDACTEGRSVASSQWRVAPDGLAIASVDTDATSAAVTLSGGTVGTLYRVSNLVVFSDGLRDERTLLVRVEKR